MSGYKKALVAAGATVHAFEDFGSYQGQWAAKVEYNGASGWIIDSYGSCAGCDSYDHEMGWTPTQENLAAFGAGYLQGLLGQAEAESRAEELSRWDGPELVHFVKTNAIVTEV